jgi:glucosamine--fructose-6-phosphate aminotransferase (isomerizing)
MLIEGPYLADLLRQPQALRDTSSALALTAALASLADDLARRRFERVVLTGMGGSLYALYPLFLELAAAGIPALWMETAELVHAAPAAARGRSLVIAASQSGRSAEIVRLLGLPDLGPVIGVTNDPGSPLAAQATATVLLRAGAESSVSCKTYVATLAALDWLSSVLRGRADDLQEAHDLAAMAAEAYLASWRSHVDSLTELLSGVTHVFVAGRGASLAAAETGGLILKEAAHIAAEGMSCAAFRHGPFEMLSGRALVTIFAGAAQVAPLNRRLFDDVIAAGGRAAWVAEDAGEAVFRLPPLADRMRPILEILPVEMMSLAIAARDGREAGRFERASKITAVE